MVKVSKESLEVFQSVLETVDTSWQTEFNLRETIRQSFGLIKKAKSHKVSWEKIAEILKQSSGVTEGISPESIRQYYFEFSKNPGLLPNKRQKSSSDKNRSKRNTVSNSSSKIERNNSEASDVSQSAESEFNLEFQLNAPPVLEVTSESSLEIPSSESQVVSQPATTDSDHQAKDAVRSQFNLGRRGK
jgi:translation initiation factor 2B subunit (eIF-2B alpha/beta/delta family)